MFTQKWIKDLPTVKIKPLVHQGHTWPLSPREIKHEAYPVRSGDCGEASNTQCAHVGRIQVPTAVRQQWDIFVRCPAPASQERQSDSSLSKCKNSKCTCCLQVPGAVIIWEKASCWSALALCSLLAGLLIEMFSANSGMGIPRVSFPKGNRKQSLRLGGQNHCSGALYGRETAPVTALGPWATRVTSLLCIVANADPRQQCPL